VNLAVFERGAKASALLVALALVACGDGTVVLPARPVATPVPVPAASAVRYTAIGASDAVGYNASVPCANPPLVAVPTCPGGTGYVPDVAKSLGANGASVTLNDLGISGAVIGPDILAVGNSYGSQGSSAPCKPRTGSDVIPADFITNELPQLTGGETVVTIFAGGNDTNAIVNAAACQIAGGASQAVVSQFVTTEITAFGNDFRNLALAIHTKSPNAKIVIANLPNFAGIPIAQQPALASAKPLLQAVSVGIDTNVYQPAATTFGIPVADLLCNPASYASADFFPGPLADGFHPNDTGYAALAAALFAQITAATPTLPLTSCPQRTLAGSARAPLAGAIPAFDRR